MIRARGIGARRGCPQRGADHRYRQRRDSAITTSALEERNIGCEWAQRFPELFDADDRRLAEAQGPLGYHFYEWLAAIVLHHTTGYFVVGVEVRVPQARPKARDRREALAGGHPSHPQGPDRAWSCPASRPPHVCTGLLGLFLLRGERAGRSSATRTAGEVRGPRKAWGKACPSTEAPMGGGPHRLEDGHSRVCGGSGDTQEAGRWPATAPRRGSAPASRRTRGRRTTGTRSGSRRSRRRRPCRGRGSGPVCRRRGRAGLRDGDGRGSGLVDHVYGPDSPSVSSTGSATDAWPGDATAAVAAGASSREPAWPGGAVIAAPTASSSPAIAAATAGPTRARPRRAAWRATSCLGRAARKEPRGLACAHGTLAVDTSGCTSWRSSALELVSAAHAQRHTVSVPGQSSVVVVLVVVTVIPVIPDRRARRRRRRRRCRPRDRCRHHEARGEIGSSSG